VSPRSQLLKLLQVTGTSELLLRLRARAPSPWLTVLTYHSVRAPGPYPFDDGVLDATPEDFERQIAVIARHCHVLGVDEIRGFANGHRLPPGAVAITFDDGYRNNHDVALPILKRHGVKAIFFVTTGFLEQRRIFWWDRAAYLLKSSKREWIEVRYPALMQVRLVGPRRYQALRAVLRLVKDFYDLELERFLDELARACDVEWNRELDRRFADELLMSWDDVRALKAAGMDVQSHTRNHLVLQTLPAAKLDDELGGSREQLESVLGDKVRALAYPVGHAIADRPRLREAVRRAGYELGFSNATGINPVWRPIDRFDIKRLAVDYQVPDAEYRGVLAIPYLAAAQ